MVIYAFLNKKRTDNRAFAKNRNYFLKRIVNTSFYKIFFTVQKLFSMSNLFENYS